MEDPSESNKGVVKEGMDVYHTGHLEKPKFPDVLGAVRISAQPQRAEVSDCWQIAPIPQIAYIYTPPPPPVTHYRLRYTRVDTFFPEVGKCQQNRIKVESGGIKWH